MPRPAALAIVILSYVALLFAPGVVPDLGRTGMSMLILVWVVAAAYLLSRMKLRSYFLAVCAMLIALVSILPAMVFVGCQVYNECP